MSFSNVKKSGDNIYYNVIIPHNDAVSAGRSIPTNADYFEIRATPLLSYPANEYLLSVVRMLIPTSEIPIQIIPIDISQPNINKTLYSVTLTYNNNDYQEKIGRAHV